jgi:hypothetical protein
MKRRDLGHPSLKGWDIQWGTDVEIVGFCGLKPAALAEAARSGWKQGVGQGLQTLAQNDRRGLKTPTYDL